MDTDKENIGGGGGIYHLYT